MKPILTDSELLEYIPQRPPIVMIDALYYASASSSKTGLTIDEDNLFLQNGKMSTMGLIENIAQTAAISAGYFYKSNNQPVKIGFIGSVKQLEVVHWPNVGDQIITEIKEIQEVMNIKIIEGIIYLNDDKIASCEMKIFILDEAPD